MGEVEGGEEFAHGLGPEGVADFGAIDCDFGDGALVGGFVTNIFEFSFGDPAHVGEDFSVVLVGVE